MRTHGLPLQLLISDWRRKPHVVDDLDWLPLRTDVIPIRDEPWVICNLSVSLVGTPPCPLGSSALSQLLQEARGTPQEPCLEMMQVQPC